MGGMRGYVGVRRDGGIGRECVSARGNHNGWRGLNHLVEGCDGSSVSWLGCCKGDDGRWLRLTCNYRRTRRAGSSRRRCRCECPSRRNSDRCRCSCECPSRRSSGRCRCECPSRRSSDRCRCRCRCECASRRSSDRCRCRYFRLGLTRFDIALGRRTGDYFYGLGGNVAMIFVVIIIVVHVTIKKSHPESSNTRITITVVQITVVYIVSRSSGIRIFRRGLSNSTVSRTLCKGRVRFIRSVGWFTSKRRHSSCDLVRSCEKEKNGSLGGTKGSERIV
jgi:hypothetical protein